MLFLFEDRNCCIDEEKYLVKDAAAERKFSFSLKDSLQRAREEGVLQGRNVYVTPSVLPPQEECAQIVRAAGGVMVCSLSCRFLICLLIACNPTDAT